MLRRLDLDERRQDHDEQHDQAAQPASRCSPPTTTASTTATSGTAAASRRRRRPRQVALALRRRRRGHAPGLARRPVPRARTSLATGRQLAADAPARPRSRSRRPADAPAAHVLVGHGPRRLAQRGRRRQRRAEGRPRPDLGRRSPTPVRRRCTAVTWKIQGNQGGEDIADPVRGPVNNGGLYGERAGWYLPGYPGRRLGARPRSRHRTRRPAPPGTGRRSTCTSRGTTTRRSGSRSATRRRPLERELPRADLRQRLEHGPVHRERRPAAHVRAAERRARTRTARTRWRSP